MNKLDKLYITICTTIIIGFLIYFGWVLIDYFIKSSIENPGASISVSIIIVLFIGWAVRLRYGKNS